jgi:hypothetical protein
MVEPESPAQPQTAQTGPPRRAHRVLVPTLLVLATLFGFVAALSVWVNRQALNTANWAETSGKLLANEQIDQALGAYLVDQLFDNVDVAAVLQQRLPSQAQVLAGPAAAGLRELANRAAPELLARPKVQDVWVAANRAAHKQLLWIVEGGGPIVSTKSGAVTLNLHELVDRLATDLGIESQVAAVRSKLQGSTGATARSVAQQKLGITLPPTSGQLVIMRSNQLETAQKVANAVSGLALVLPILMIASFALAVWLAQGWRRQALRTSGWCFVVIGLLVLLTRRVAGNEVVDTLVKVPSNAPAVHEVWNVATSLLYAIAVALIVYGIVIVLCAALAGPTRPATFVRKALAPILRDRPGAAYGAVGVLLLLLVVWGPTPAFRQLAWIALFAALLALGVTVLRGQVAEEFPGVQRGEALRELRERWAARRSGDSAAARRAGDEAPGQVASPVAEADRRTDDRVGELERLAQLHERGVLDDQEFAAEKRRVISAS